MINSTKKEEKVNSNQFCKKIIKKKILKFAKNTKDISIFNKNLNNTVEKPKINFKKIGHKTNLFENNNEKIKSNDKKKILKVVKTRQPKLSLNRLYYYKNKEIIKRNSNKIQEKEFKSSDLSISIKSVAVPKNIKFNSIYYENYQKISLPEIQTFVSKKDKYNKNNLSSYLKFDFASHLVLPRIKSNKNDINFQSYIPEFMMEFNFRKKNCNI